MPRRSKKGEGSGGTRPGGGSGGPERYEIVVAPTAVEMLAAVRDRRHQRLLNERIEGLRQEPEKQGKPLEDEFRGFRSVRAVGRRYRIIYRVDGGEVRVYVVAVGLRREGSRADVYRAFGRVAAALRRAFGW